jgi:hypothetical protein
MAVGRIFQTKASQIPSISRFHLITAICEYFNRRGYDELTDQNNKRDKRRLQGR